MDNQDNVSGSTSLQVIIAWAIVGIPLAWAVYMTFTKVLALFG